MADENSDIPLAMEEVSEAEVSQEESFDIPVVAVANISEPEDITEESIDIIDIIDIPATIEVNEPESCKVEVIVDTDSNTPKIRPKVLSRYLRPHTGSCHDFCKYGSEHALEGKPASPVSRKAKLVGGNSQDLRRTIVSLAKQNKESNSPKSSQEYNPINITDLKEDIISSPEIVTPPKRLLPSTKEVQAAAVHYSRTKLNLSSSKVSSFAGQGSSRTKRNKEIRKGKKKDGDGSLSSSNSTSRSLEMNISAEEDITALVPEVGSRTPKTRVKRVAIADKKSIGRNGLKSQIHHIKCKPDPSNNEDVEEKTLYMIEPSSKNETEGMSQSSLHTTESSQPQSSSTTDNNLKHEQEAVANSIVPPMSEKKNVVKRARNGTSPKILSTSPTVFKGIRPKRFGMVQRSETRSAPSSPLSSRSQSEPIHVEHRGSTSGNGVKKIENSKVDHRLKTRRMTLTDSENGDCQSRKLKFRKGRMVELQPETSTPRRLKFRRVRLLGEAESPKGDSRKRNIKGKEGNQNGKEVKEGENSSLRQQDKDLKKKRSFRDGKLVSSRFKSERVVLRHQDSKGKKEVLNLFNNVIEETASKLAKTRKSKVKALVGAFETVISLQDTKPTATTSVA
ncbi:CaM_binding domain-containing protein [Cucumis melo var. makuwa]|uniref:CaM_binding domain-containing protein n=2 Tax=Cucumis melo TaxID=3656 RepID=A0A5D3BIK3_CUCMM|nr:CaM_binding domain-containing protein [Cucumis melo var. makuwa]